MPHSDFSLDVQSDAPPLHRFLLASATPTLSTTWQPRQCNLSYQKSLCNSTGSSWMGALCCL